MHATPGGPTPTGGEAPRDLEQEADFLQNVFENFDRKVIQAVLKQFATHEDAFIHLAEFNDLNYNSDDDEQMEEEVKGQSAAQSMAQNDEAFNESNVYRVGPGSLN